MKANTKQLSARNVLWGIPGQGKHSSVRSGVRVHGKEASSVR